MSIEHKDTSNCEAIIVAPIELKPLPLHFCRSPLRTLYILPEFDSDQQIGHVHWCEFPAKSLIKHCEMWIGGDLISPTYWCSDCDKEHKHWSSEEHDNLPCYLKAQLKN